MRGTLAFATAIAAAINAVSADLCSEGSQLINGNWYCQAVKKITYQGVGGRGSYNKVTNMDPSTGSCSSTPYSYSGSMSPLDEDVSIHFRGPLTLKQFAVYKPSDTKKAKRNIQHRRHGHAHFHEHNADIVEMQKRAEADKQKRAVGDVVIATINGDVVSWINSYDGSKPAATPAPAPAPASAAPAPAATTPLNEGYIGAANGGSTGKPSANVAPGDWGQVGYYNADAKSSHGIAFLNNMGGQGSGVFDMVFGNSLSYASPDGASGAASPQLFGGSLKSNQEVSIFTDQKCGGGDCGYVRPGTVAHHGFDGPKKAFFMEFGMPDDGNSGWNQNMPAVWALNAQIPRTLQYGKADCSCWTSGCGEFDMFEVLDSGNERCKSTLHGNINGGNSDYFQRPTTGTIKAAVVFYNDDIHMQLLDNNTDFGSVMSSDTIGNICKENQDGTTYNGIKNSVFRLVQS